MLELAEQKLYETEEHAKERSALYAHRSTDLAMRDRIGCWSASETERRNVAANKDGQTSFLPYPRDDFLLSLGREKERRCGKLERRDVQRPRTN